MAHRLPLDQMRFQRDVEHLHSLGPRALGEFLDELIGKVGGAPACSALLADYGQLTTRVLRSVGGDRFPPQPLREALA